MPGFMLVDDATANTCNALYIIAQRIWHVFVACSSSDDFYQEKVDTQVLRRIR